MTWFKVTVTSLWKLEILPFLKSISSAIATASGNWSRILKLQHNIWMRSGRIFDVWPSFRVTWLWSWQKRQFMKSRPSVLYGADLLLLLLLSVCAGGCSGLTGEVWLRSSDVGWTVLDAHWSSVMTSCGLTALPLTTGESGCTGLMAACIVLRLHVLTAAIARFTFSSSSASLLLLSLYELVDGHWLPASTWMTSPPQRPAVTLTFEPQNLVRSSVGSTEYSLYVSSRLRKPLVRYRGNKICPVGRTDCQNT